MEMIKLSEHFQLSEFKCRNGVMPPANFQNTIRPTVAFLEAMRLATNILAYAKTGDPKLKTIGLVITSGFRTKEYNEQCGGAKQSRHVSGHAVDFKPTIPYSKEIITYNEFCFLAEKVDDYFEFKPYRLGFYPSKGNNAWIHIDCAFGFGGRRWTE